MMPCVAMLLLLRSTWRSLFSIQEPPVGQKTATETVLGMPGWAARIWTTAIPVSIPAQPSCRVTELTRIVTGVIWQNTGGVTLKSRCHLLRRGPGHCRAERHVGRHAYAGHVWLPVFCGRVNEGVTVQRKQD